MYLDEEAVRAVLGWDQLIAEMETALTALSRGRVIQPTRSMITIEEDKRYLGIMPAVAEAAMGLKLVSFYPGNAGTAVPTHLAMILLFRTDTGEPLAVMDGRLITEMRTAAVSAAVTRRLGRARQPRARPHRERGPGGGPSGGRSPACATSMRSACGAGRLPTPSASPARTTLGPWMWSRRYGAPTWW